MGLLFLVAMMVCDTDGHTRSQFQAQTFTVITTVLPTTPIAVTVYPQQARVTRQGTLAVTPGHYRLTVEGLPSQLQLDSVQAHPRGTAPGIVTELEVVPQKNGEAGAVAALEECIQGLERQLRQMKEAIAALSLQREFITTLAQRSARTCALGMAQGQITLDTISTLLTYLGERHISLGEQIAHKEQEKIHLDQDLQRLRQQLKTTRTHPPLGYQVEISLRILAPGTLTLDLIYGVEQAGWDAAYNVRFGQEPDQLYVESLAQVRQGTGEDWPQVQLTLATAPPEKSPVLPHPEAWYVTLPTPETPGKNHRRGSPILQETYRMLGAVPGSELPPSAMEGESLPPHGMEAIAVLRFQVSEPITLISQAAAQSVPLGQQVFSSQFTYVALPQQGDAPYLQAHLVNPDTASPLLPGMARLFRDGGYIGQEQLSYVAPGQAFQLSLGQDERIQIHRELVGRENTETSPAHLSLSYRLGFHNSCPHTITLTVLERIPISSSDRIHVTLEMADPTPTHPEPGICQWVLTLPPEVTTGIEYQYDVEYPQGATVVGLDV